MYPILGRYGPFFLYTYSVVMGLGLLAGIGLSFWQTRSGRSSGYMDGILILLGAGILGGRVGFVVAHLDYYRSYPFEAWHIWSGGLSYHGALLAGLTASWFWCRKQKRSFVTFGGSFAPGLALTSAFGWLACWFDGCAYGKITQHGPIASDLPDKFGVYAVRYQTQLLGMIICLFIFLLLVALRSRWPEAQLFWLALFGLSLGRVLISLLRADPVSYLGPIRVDSLVDAMLALGSLLLLQYDRKRHISGA